MRKIKQKCNLEPMYGRYCTWGCLSFLLGAEGDVARAMLHEDLFYRMSVNQRIGPLPVYFVSIIFFMKAKNFS